MAAAAEDRGDLESAADYFQQALVIAEPGSLSVAVGLNGVGFLAHERGDLDLAEDYLRGALAIRDQLAPNSLYHANSLGNLGIVEEPLHLVVSATLLAELRGSRPQPGSEGNLTLASSSATGARGWPESTYSHKSIL